MADRTTIQYHWAPVQTIWQTLKGPAWKQRKFSELNDNDRTKFLTACAKLVMIDDQSAMFIRQKVVDELHDIASEIYRDLGSAVFNLAGNEEAVGSLLAVDFLVMYIEREMDRSPGDAAELIILLPEPAQEAVKRRQYQFGITCPDKPFKEWTDEQRRLMVKPLFDLVWRELKKGEPELVHTASVQAGHDALTRTWHHLQLVSRQLEEDVRTALGEHIFEIAKLEPQHDRYDDKPKLSAFGLTHLPAGAHPYVLAYIRHKVDVGKVKVERLFGQLDHRLARILMEAYAEQTEATAES